MCRHADDIVSDAVVPAGIAKIRIIRKFRTRFAVCVTFMIYEYEIIGTHVSPCTETQIISNANALATLGKKFRLY